MSQNAYYIAQQIKSKLSDRRPQIAIILGSGLGGLANDIENAIYIDYESIDGFPTSTVSGHQGRLISGFLNGKEVICMQGRIHLYEGYPASNIADIIKSFKLLEIKTLIVTNAAGSLHQHRKPGSLMLIEDHINLSGFNPLIGSNDETFGPRFPNMNEIYTLSYRQKALDIAKRLNISLHQGVYCMLSGPAFETAAEVKMCRTIGADANGMSTVPETITAAYCGIKVLGISALTNYCTGIEGGTPTHAETLETAAKAANDLTLLVKQFVGEL
ncbi:MAG: purine-nucleoside phosphorylase [Alphaproteobacteria bacterium]|nr:purine-nucleoside phosphorylase [Alphaproteobacteria bacterium]